jgi:hypothetical protein
MNLLCRYHRRLTSKYPSEERQMSRIRAGLHLLTDQDLLGIRNDHDAEVAREIADTELERRAGLTAHDKMAEAAARRRAAAC